MTLTKRQRAKLLTAEDRALVEGMEFERLLALHDLTHEVMMIKAGTSARSDAEAAFNKRQAARNT